MLTLSLPYLLVILSLDFLLIFSLFWSPSDPFTFVLLLALSFLLFCYLCHPLSSSLFPLLILSFSLISFPDFLLALFSTVVLFSFAIPCLLRCFFCWSSHFLIFLSLSSSSPYSLQFYYSHCHPLSSSPFPLFDLSFSSSIFPCLPLAHPLLPAVVFTLPLFSPLDLALSRPLGTRSVDSRPARSIACTSPPTQHSGNLQGVARRIRHSLAPVLSRTVKFCTKSVCYSSTFPPFLLVLNSFIGPSLHDITNSYKATRFPKLL